MAAGLQELHIVPVRAPGMTVEALPSFKMTNVHGESLRARLINGTVPLVEAIAVLHDGALALAYSQR